MARGGCGWASQIGGRHFSEADGALNEGAAAEDRALLENVPAPLFLRGGCRLMRRVRERRFGFIRRVIGLAADEVGRTLDSTGVRREGDDGKEPSCLDTRS